MPCAETSTGCGCAGRIGTPPPPPLFMRPFPFIYPFICEPFPLECIAPFPYDPFDSGFGFKCGPFFCLTPTPPLTPSSSSGSSSSSAASSALPLAAAEEEQKSTGVRVSFSPSNYSSVVVSSCWDAKMEI